MTTAVDAVFIGKERRFNRRFLQMCSHYLVEPTACTPAAGWEKGQVENQVGNIARAPLHAAAAVCRLCRAERLAGGALPRPCRASAHPEQERQDHLGGVRGRAPSLIGYPGPFDGFHEIEVAVSKSSLVRFDHNRYSVADKAARRTAQLRAYADRIVVWWTARSSASMPAASAAARPSTIPGIICRCSTRKPGALRNGDPFRDWDLPPALAQIRRRLAGHDDGDRQFVDILAAVAEDGLEAVEAACAEALSARAVRPRRRAQHPGTAARADRRRPVATPAALALAVEPAADCARYDQLRRPLPAEEAY